jgi:thiamine-monophosphate kinase
VTAPAIGEQAIIANILEPLTRRHPGALGLADDAALLPVPAGHEIVATMDAIAAGVHFFPNDSPADLGWKALAVNVSDLIAKGAEPHAYLMSLAFPDPPQITWLEQFANGLTQAQQAFGITLVGGDTDRRPGPLSVTITALGFVPAGRMVRRGTAQPGDSLFMTGTLGDSALGLALRGRTSRAKGWPMRDTDRDWLEHRYLRPQPRVGIIQALRDHASAAMDISDGLMKDLGRMAKASDVSAIVDADRIPLSDAARAIVSADPDTIDIIATGGDDYEVLASVPPSSAEAFRRDAASAGVIVSEIGTIGQRPEAETDSVTLRKRDGTVRLVARPGYDHF